MQLIRWDPKTKESLHFNARATSTNIFHYRLDIFFSSSVRNFWRPIFHIDRFERSGWNSATRNAVRKPHIHQLWNSELIYQKYQKKNPLRASGYPAQLASWCAVKRYVSLLLNGKLIAGDNIMRQNIYNTVSPSLRQPERKKNTLRSSCRGHEKVYKHEPPRIRGAHRDQGMRAILLASPCSTCVTDSEEWLLLFGEGGCRAPALLHTDARGS